MDRILVATLTFGLSVLMLTGCDDGSSAPNPDGARRTQAPGSPRPGFITGAWTRLPDSGLSPRDAPAAAHVPTDDGDLVVFVGGDTGPPCPPNASCILHEDSKASDGAAYDLETGTWRPITTAPRPIAPYSSTAVLDDTLYVLTDGDLLAWDATEDTWTELDAPAKIRDATLVADTFSGRSRLVLASPSDEIRIRPDRTYDPADDSWSRLPANPLRPSFDRVLIPTPSGLVLTAHRIGTDGGPDDPSLVHAAVLRPGATEWEVFPANDDQLGGRYSWTGQRLVDPTVGGADGGQVNNYGRTIPYGGALDPATGAWSALRDAPKQFSGGWGVDAPGGPLSAVDGWVYDDGDAGRGNTWTRLPQPDDAPEMPGRGVWVDDLLIVSGGADGDGIDGTEKLAAENVWSTGTWAYLAG